MKQLRNEFAFCALLFLLCLLIAAFCVFCTSAQADSTTVMYVDVAYGSFLNVRTDPDVGSPYFTRKHRGDEVYVSREEDGWSFLVCAEGNQCGWAKSEYLTYDKPEMKSIGAYTVTGNGRVAVHKSDGGVLWKEVGSSVTVLDWKQDGDVLWALVKGGKMDGSYLEVAQ